ncbi:MAG TPA: metal-sensitive transcriptional regulator [Thermosynergistes sp.]|nr:metal-sensitive transcriptional regulator [Thermosynergistes sp.]HPZ75937.1 metal-sensitive transcriptional regulator [Thermosynergistes sp.]HQE21045.1 metal-sensitive transcriptional regulator [Thermosynergistes sp.]HXK89120.1 metal-sensitive transcriptional regulator [Thermosynergistes sp.]
MTKSALMQQIEDVAPEKKAILNRLKRVEGQLRGIQRMIVEDRPCRDILIQLSAARKAMQQTCIEILKGYVHKCFREGEPTEKSLEELETVVSALLDIAPPLAQEEKVEGE